MALTKIKTGSVSDSITLTTPTISGVLTANGGAVFNEASADVDFRVESDGNANMLFVDGGNDAVGIGVVPDTSGSGYTNLQINGYAYNIGHSGGDHYITNNAYHNSGWKYGQTSSAQMVELSSGMIQFKTVNSGSADAAITWVRSMNILDGGGVVVNEDGVDMDFRVESDTNTHALFVDGGGDRVGIGLVPTYKLDVLNTTGNVVSARFTTTATAAQSYGPAVILTNDPNDTTRYLFAGGSASTNRFVIYSNGNIQNQNNSYTAISDEKLKENIVDAGSQWDDIKALRVRKYSLKEENASEPTQIGVIAQEVEAAGMSGLVYETPDQDTAEDGTIEDTGEVTKNMKYSILYMKAIKALQEAQTRIESLETLTESLAARLEALEGE